jgi:hypothetical protein
MNRNDRRTGYDLTYLRTSQDENDIRLLERAVR